MTTYSICLDDVDLALLPLRTNDFLKKEHYQFQVIKEQVTEVPVQSHGTYTCHICAIEVPAVFVGEHAASVKHRTNARIASVATQRTRAHIFALPPPLPSQSSLRFCAHCTAIVDEDHNKTKEHRVAVMHDNLLCELMKAYVGDDDEPKSDKNAGNNMLFEGNHDESHISNNKDDKLNKNIANTDNIINNVATQKISDPKLQTEDKTKVTKGVQPMVNCENNIKAPEKHKAEISSNADIVANNNSDKSENNSHTNSVSPTASRWVKSSPQSKHLTENETGQNKSETIVTNGTETKVIHPREPYEKELRKFMDANNEFQIKESYNRIQLKIHNDTVNVYSDHFHSFHRLYRNGGIECMVCNITFNEKDTEAHKYSLNHMSGVVKIGSDGEYVREIDESYSHCILCNQKINNINLSKHKQSNHHVLRKTNNIRSIKRKETDTQRKEDSNQTSNDTNTSKVDLNKLPYKEVNGELMCVVCDCRVPKDGQNRKDHANGFRHMNNLYKN